MTNFVASVKSCTEPLTTMDEPIDTKRLLKEGNPNYELLSAYIHNKALYFITLKCNITEEFVSVPYYASILMKFKSSGHVFFKRYELDKHDKLHLHFIYGMHKTTYFKKLLPKGCHINYKKVYNLQGVFKYLSKQSHNIYQEEQMVSCHYFRHHFSLK